jgi:hypothetical protein
VLRKTHTRKLPGSHGATFALGRSGNETRDSIHASKGTRFARSPGCATFEDSLEGVVDAGDAPGTCRVVRSDPQTVTRRRTTFPLRRVGHAMGGWSRVVKRCRYPAGNRRRAPEVNVTDGACRVRVADPAKCFSLGLSSVHDAGANPNADPAPYVRFLASGGPTRPSVGDRRNTPRCSRSGTPFELQGCGAVLRTKTLYRMHCPGKRVMSRRIAARCPALRRPAMPGRCVGRTICAARSRPAASARAGRGASSRTGGSGWRVCPRTGFP